MLWGEEVRERFNAPELNLARYIKDGIVTDADNGEYVRAFELPRPQARMAIRGGWPSLIATASIAAAWCSGRWKRWSRPNSSAWYSPSALYGDRDALTRQSLARKSNAALWRLLTAATPPRSAPQVSDGVVVPIMLSASSSVVARSDGLLAISA